MERMRFAPDFTRFSFQIGFGNGDHAQEEFGFARFLAASADAMLEIRLGNSVIRFAVIRTDACSRSDKLVNQPVVDRVQGIFLEKRIMASPKRAVRSSKS